MWCAAGMAVLYLCSDAWNRSSSCGWVAGIIVKFAKCYPLNMDIAEKIAFTNWKIICTVNPINILYLYSAYGCIHMGYPMLIQYLSLHCRTLKSSSVSLHSARPIRLTSGGMLLAPSSSASSSSSLASITGRKKAMCTRWTCVDH